MPNALPPLLLWVGVIYMSLKWNLTAFNWTESLYKTGYTLRPLSPILLFHNKGHSAAIKGSKDKATNGPLSPSPYIHTPPMWLAPSFLSEKEAEGSEQSFLKSSLQASLHPQSHSKYMSLVLQDLGILATLTFRQQTRRNTVLPQDTEQRLPICLAPEALPSQHAMENKQPKPEGQECLPIKNH